MPKALIFIGLGVLAFASILGLRVLSSKRSLLLNFGLQPGGGQGLKVTYRHRIARPESSQLKSGGTLVSYYFEDGSYWIDVPPGILVHDAARDLNFFYRRSGERKLFSLGPQMGEEVKYLRNPRGAERCELGGEVLPCSSWEERIVPLRRPPSQRLTSYVALAKIFKPEENYRKVIESLGRFYGKESLEAAGLHYSVQVFLFPDGEETFAGSLEVTGVEPFRGLSLPGDLITMHEHLPRCDIQRDYVCE